MQVHQTFFVKDKDQITIQKEDHMLEECQPTYSFADLFVKSIEIEPYDHYIEPGIIIKYKNGKIYGYATDNCMLFEHSCSYHLQMYTLINDRLYAVDSIGNIYIFKKDLDKPIVHNIGTRPNGYIPIPETDTIVFWTLAGLYTFDCYNNERKLLKGHHSKVVACDVSLTNVVSGDSLGDVCIWFNSSLVAAEHVINIGPVSIKSIIIYGDYVYCLTELSLDEIDIQTGIINRKLSIKATDMIRVMDGFLLSDKRGITFVSSMLPISYVKCAHKRIIASDEENRFSTLSNKKIVECNWLEPNWPQKFTKWVQKPSFPIKEQWPKGSLMEILALTADIWVPRLKNMHIPTEWFRNESLRNAIWDTVLENDLEMNMQHFHLTKHIIHEWHTKNLKKLITLTKEPEYNPCATRILERLYKKIPIENINIQTWCWEHLGVLALKPIIVHILSNTRKEFIFAHISKTKVKPDAAPMLHPKVIQNGLDKGYIAIFIKILIAYHKKYPNHPSAEMKKSFQLLCSHVYSSIESLNLAIPLEESGEWELLKRPNPSHLGAIIKQRNMMGNITKIDFIDGIKIQWIPLRSQIELYTLEEEDTYIWKYYHNEGPHTILECAMTLLAKELWENDHKRFEFHWPETEVGIFECRATILRVFDETVRIADIEVLPDNAVMHVTNGIEIYKNDNIEIQTIAPLWSYYDDQLYHIIPMKLKICNEIVRSKTKIPQLSIKYAKELCSCIRYQTIDTEHKYKQTQKISCISKGFVGFFIGFDSGDIIEYESAAHFKPYRHFIRHEYSIINIHPTNNKLVSLCEEQLIVWSLKSASILFKHTGSMTMINFAIIRNTNYIWTAEREEDQIFLTLWDTELCNSTKQTLMYSTKEIFIIEGPYIITDTYCRLIGSDTLFEIELTGGFITCATNTSVGPAGGTSNGYIFLFHREENKLYEWYTEMPYNITCITNMDDQPYVIIGTEYGEISIWSINNDPINIATKRISTSKINHIYFDNMFAIATYAKNIELFSIVQEKCVLAVNMIETICKWNSVWKERLTKETHNIIQPAIEKCIIQRSGTIDAINLLDFLTEDYADRLPYCKQKFIDILMDTPRSCTNKILRKLAAFHGPKLDCVICNDPDFEDKICYIKTCHHRFHRKCILKLIQKAPEYHQTMQEEYALDYNIKCPTCREPFEKNDVKDDIFLNQHFSK